MTRIFIKLATLITASVLLAAGPVAAKDKTYLTEFKAYQAALDNGDTKSAISHGYAAWQAAEAELGDDRLTAILAYNYGSLAIYDDPAKANASLARAKALADAGLGDLPQTDLELYLAYAGFKLNQDSRRQTNTLRKILEDLSEKNIPPNTDTANMWFDLAIADIHRKRYRAGKKSASKAESFLAVAYPDNFRSRAFSIILQGVSEIMPMLRTEARTAKAIETFQRAASLFPPQESIDNFDEILATAFAWEATGNAVYRSNDYNLKRLPESESEARLFAGEHKSMEDCSGEWEDRDPPKYPRKELNRGYLGAVIIGYNFGDDTSVHDARILAEVPDGAFSDAVLEEVSNWKLITPLPDDPSCRNNRITWVTFVID